MFAEDDVLLDYRKVNKILPILHFGGSGSMKISDVTFSQEARKSILELYGKTVDAEGFIVESENPKQRVLTPSGEEIQIDEWAGIRKGSEAFIKSDTFSLIELAKRLE